MYGFFAVINRIKYLKRWSRMPNIREETVAQHSYLVAVLAHAIGVIHNAEVASSEMDRVDPNKLAVYGLYDDVAEIITGDPPTPVKYANEQIRNAYEALTQQASSTMLATLPLAYQAAYKPILECELSDLEKQLLKGADDLAALIHCVEERQLGNKREFRAAHRQKLNRVKEGPPAVVSFANKYLESFGKSLDELTHPDV
jgi:5'-deoxynucleotidase